MLTDAHTHRQDACDAIISLSPYDIASCLSSYPDAIISTGIHPWNSTKPVDLDQLSRTAALPAVVAIGEAGLDKHQGARMDIQIELLKSQIALSETLQKPLILHCVKAWDILLKLKRELKPQQNWAIHGFRGNEHLATQLLENGFYLSLGEHFNNATARIIPDDRLLVETDESLLPIAQIISSIALLRPTPPPFAQTLKQFLTTRINLK